MSRRPPAHAQPLVARTDMSKASLDLLSVPGSEKGQTLLRPFSDPSPTPLLHALWLGIHLPRLALEVHTRLETTRPLAIIDGEDRLHRVLVCDARASAFGVRPGLGLNVALALAPQLCAIARDARREQAALVRLAGWAGQFTPRVSLTPPDALLLEVRGSLALFGGVDANDRELRDTWEWDGNAWSLAAEFGPSHGGRTR